MLNTPYKGTLIDLCVPAAERAAVAAEAGRPPSIVLSDRAVCDLELLANGAFSPLTGFMNAADVARVLDEMRLADGTLFPIPITLPVVLPEGVGLDQEVALRDRGNNLLAVMRIAEIAPWDREAFGRHAFGTTDAKHPLVAEMARWGAVNIAGPLRVLRLPAHYDFPGLRMTPSETRATLDRMGATKVVAFQTRNPLHRAHEELTKRAMATTGGTLLLHPSVGMTRPGDVDHYTRVRTYQALVKHHYAERSVLLSLLPLAMRMAGPREALWHAIIRRNYGASHMIIGRDHASPGIDSTGKPFYGPYDARDLVMQHQAEIGVTPVDFAEMVFLPDEDRFEEVTKVPKGSRTVTISGTEVREKYLDQGRTLPEWFTRPETAAILGEAYPPTWAQGAVIWFTGLSGAGKSTTAEILVARLLEHGRQSTVLDGDVVRTHLSKGLGFSKEDRDANILRIGFVAAEVARHGGIAVCAAISPYRETRDAVRRMVARGRFFEVFVDAPLSVCESRDIKGLYAKARRGELKGFTGVDDPYEAPTAPEIILDSATQAAAANADVIVRTLLDKGLIR
jgi:sulfate adenylyltransferase